MSKSSAEMLQNTTVLRINDVKTLQLIREYKKEECLWNTLLDDYPNRHKRVLAAEKIARILNIQNFNGKHVMIKFKNLRNSYCQELKKIEHSLSIVGSEDSPDLYRPKVRWFPLMDSFIRPHLQKPRPIGLPTHSLQQKGIQPNVKMEFYEIDEQEDWPVPLNDSITAETSYSQSDQFASENDELSNDSRVKRRRLSNSSNHSQHFNQNQVFLQTDIPSQRTLREDTFDSFGKYIASLLRNLPAEQALRLQPKIVTMIVEVGIEEQKVRKVEIDSLEDYGEAD